MILLDLHWVIKDGDVMNDDVEYGILSIFGFNFLDREGIIEKASVVVVVLIR